jgi:acyl-CoA synthetase (AMP-forming)/AMP-acid ligase II
MSEPDCLRLPRLNDYIGHYARTSAAKPAMIQHEDGKTLTYKQFHTLIDFFALRLMDMGIGAGDRVATQLVLVPEHMALMYACFKIGALLAPLDVRLQDAEVVRDVNKIAPKAFFFLGDTPVRDFRTAGQAVQAECPGVDWLVQFTADPQPGDILPGALGITQLMDKKRLVWLKLKDIVTRRSAQAYAAVTPDSPALIIFTTGTTGEPKPAMLSHANIIVQNEILARGMSPLQDPRILINLPPSHVGCVTECFMTTMFMGGTAILLRIFDVKLTLEAIQQHRVNALGQIPTQYRMLWHHPDYDSYDLSSLAVVVYGGSAVDTEFLRKLSRMAPDFGTGIGMTENAGFATFTPRGIPIEEMAGQVGRAFPDLAEVTIRRPMLPDGQAGPELPDGEVGEICYHPPIVFLGYYNMPEETARTISKEGILYTGDLGSFKDMGSYRALYLAGRRKFMIKQKGYNVFPDEIENHIAELPGVDTVAVVGMKHRLFDEGVFAYVRPEAGAELTPQTVQDHCRKIASYKRPQHVELWPADEEFPITRSTKVDKLAIQKVAAERIAELREEGAWDA